MPYGYLVSATILALGTGCAVAPRRRSPVAATVSFYAGFMLNEVPAVGLYWLVAATALAVGQGDVDSLVGWLSLGLSVLTAAGLAIVGWRQTTAGRALDRALDEGLGTGWQATVDARTASPPRPGTSFARVLFLPARARRRDVERIADLSYGDAGVRNLLDVYRPRSRPTGCPTFVHLHGGRLRRGRKNQQAMPLLYSLASRGWVCVSANYRLLPAATFPDHLVDVKKLIAWLRVHGEEYGADPTTLFLAGSSAGGQLAALAALTANDPAYQPGFADADTSVTAAVCLYGWYGWRRPSSSNPPPDPVPGPDPGGPPDVPLSHVRADAPPFFVVHGDRDTVVAVEVARAFVAALRRVSDNPVVYAELPGAQHGFDTFHSLRGDNVINGIGSFAGWVRSGARYRR